jgi:hypothetical protein
MESATAAPRANVLGDVAANDSAGVNNQGVPGSLRFKSPKSSSAGPKVARFRDVTQNLLRVVAIPLGYLTLLCCSKLLSSTASRPRSSTQIHLLIVIYVVVVRIASGRQCALTSIAGSFVAG